MEERETTKVRKTSTYDDETAQTQESVTRVNRASGSTVAKRVVYYIGGVIVALLVVRLILQLLGANEGNGFVDLIYALTTPLILPFYGIFGEPTYGQAQLETSTLVAIVVYGLITVGIAKLFTITKPRA